MIILCIIKNINNDHNDNNNDTNRLWYLIIVIIFDLIVVIIKYYSGYSQQIKHLLLDFSASMYNYTTYLYYFCKNVLHN